MRIYWIVGVALCCSLSAMPIEAHSISLKLGRFAPRVTSELWSDNLEVFSIERQDFDAFAVGVEGAIDAGEFLDVTLGVETSSRSVRSNYRDFVRDDDTEIRQELRLRITPVTGGLRLFPTGRYSRVRPFVAAGVGVYVYEYLEDGEFIDFDTFDVFVDTFVDRGAAFGGFVGGGLWFTITESVSVFGEYRRHWARGSHGRDFEGFGRFDLGGNQASIGFDFRF